MSSESIPDYSSVASATGIPSSPCLTLLNFVPRASPHFSLCSCASWRRSFSTIGSSHLPRCWRTHDAKQLSTPQAFKENPGLVWVFYLERREDANEGRASQAKRRVFFYQYEYRWCVSISCALTCFNLLFQSHSSYADLWLISGVFISQNRGL
jgi:hypothetical protein